MRNNQFNHILAICLIILTTFVTAIEAKNRDPQAHVIYDEAVIAYRSRHFNLAKETFYKLIKEYPDDVITDIARINLANMLNDLKEYDKAIEMNYEIIEKSNREYEKTEAKIRILNILYSTHRYREGIELLEKWTKEQPRDIELSLKLAQFYLQSGNKDEAWLILEKHMANGDKKAFKDLLELSIKSGEIDKLINTLDSHRTSLKVSTYADYLSDCYLALGRKDKAIEALKDCKNYDKDITILRKLSDIQISANKIDDAIDTLNKLYSFLPSDLQIIRKIGHCYFLKGDKDKALETWKRILTRRYANNEETYMTYTSILIEHRLLEEALKAFAEARKNLGQDTIFAEEKAAVLESLGRDKEALEEYLNVLAEGIYKSEIFDKLYKANTEGFSLEKRLTALNKGDFNQAIKQSLIELYFRKANLADINKIVDLLDNDSAIFFDDLFYDRLRQEALLVPENFHFTLIKKMMDSRKDSPLELRLASLILKMPDYCEKWENEAYEYAKKAANSNNISDSELKNELYIKLAEYAFYKLKLPKEADEFLTKLLNQNVISPSNNLIIEAKLLKARLHTYMSDFPTADETLSEVASIIERANQNGGLSTLEQEDFLMQQKVESARLKAHMEQYQDALDTLKDIIENHKEGEWVNDGLEIALEITRYSLGDFSAIKHKFKAKRYELTGQNDKAIEEIDEAIKVLPASATYLIADLEADKIMLSNGEKDFDSFADKINQFMVKNPDNLRNPDIADYKIKIMQRLNKQQDLIDEEMQTFINSFPSDLRSGTYKQSLENGDKK